MGTRTSKLLQLAVLMCAAPLISTADINAKASHPGGFSASKQNYNKRHIVSPSKSQLGPKLIVGFNGTNPKDSQVQEIAKLAKAGYIGGVIFFSYNIQTPEQVRTLTKFFKSLETPNPLLIAIDQEGGKVQRLKPENGHKTHPAAEDIAEMSEDDAAKAYAGMAKELEYAGFNLVLGPVADLHHNPDDPAQKTSPVIGGMRRSYGADPQTVIKYAGIYMHAMHEAGLFVSLKHFPGHGFALKDSHGGLVDITNIHNPIELEPFYALMDQTDMIMTAHLSHKGWDPEHPVTLSSHIIKDKLRAKGYDGVVISDCLNMGAIAHNYNLADAVALAVKGDVDLLIISNNDGANVSGARNNRSQSLTGMIVSLHERLSRELSNTEWLLEQMKHSNERIRDLWKAS